jgi:ornithine carbamoyltransferase
MMSLKGRDFISLQDYKPEELWQILRFARALKEEPHRRLLSGKCLAMIFQKPSTRTSPGLGPA